MRATSKEFYDRINKMMYNHIVVTPVFRDGADTDDEDDDASDYDEDDEELAPLLLDVAAPTYSLPGFTPRYYDSIWGYSANDSRRLDAAASLLKRFTRVIELPLQLNLCDMTWFERQDNIKTARLYHDPSVSLRPEFSWDDEGEQYHEAPLLANKIVLLPSKCLKTFNPFDQFDNRVELFRKRCDKVVSHVAYSSSGPFFIARVTHSAFDFYPIPSPLSDMVYMFTELESDDDLSFLSSVS